MASYNEVRPTTTLPIWDQYLQAIKQSDSAFGASLFVYPEVMTNEATFTWFKHGKEAFTGSGSTTPAAGHGERAIGGGFVRLPKTSLTTQAGSVREFGFELVLDRTLVQRSQVPENLERSAVDRLRREYLIARELRVSSIVTATASITSNVTLAGGDQWSAYATSDPIDDIETAKETLSLAWGYDPAVHSLCALTNDQTARQLAWHPQFAAIMPDSSMKKASPEWLAAAFGLDEVYVARSIRNSAAHQLTPVMARIWGDDFLLFIKPRFPALESVGLGATVVYEAENVTVYAEEQNKADVYRVSGQEQNLLIEATAGYLIKDCLA